jgi:hypothetical protein
MLDPLPPRIAIVLDGQLALIRPQLLQATIETVETLFPNYVALVRLEIAARADARARAARSRDLDDPRLVEGDLPAIAPDVLEQDESRDHVTISSRRPGEDHTGLLQRSGDAIERLVRQLISSRAIPPIEVRDQSSTHLEISLAVRVHSVVQPLEQSCKCDLRKCWFFSKDFSRKHVRPALCLSCVLMTRIPIKRRHLRR